MDCEIKHKKELKLFTTDVDGYSAWLEYLVYKDYINVMHTFVPKPISGRGIGDMLMKELHAYALANNMRIVATCSYAKKWLQKHPEYAL